MLKCPLYLLVKVVCVFSVGPHGEKPTVVPMEHVTVGGRGVEEGRPTVAVDSVEASTISFLAQVLGKPTVTVGHRLKKGHRITFV